MANANVSIIMDVTDSQRMKRQKAITNISTTATNIQLLDFANAINALTTDTLEKVTRVEKRELIRGEETAYKIIGDTNILSIGTGDSAEAFRMYALRNNQTGEFVNTSLTWNVTFAEPLDTSKISMTYNGGSASLPINATNLDLYTNLKSGVTTAMEINFVVSTIAPDGATIILNVTAQYVPSI